MARSGRPTGQHRFPFMRRIIAASLTSDEWADSSNSMASSYSFKLTSSNATERLRTLRASHRVPSCFYFAGQLEDVRDACSLAIVGSRKASLDGLHAARFISSQMARRDIVVVSGLALGVDSAAHRGCLDGRGRTIAVLGTGMAPHIKKTDDSLYREVVKRGAVFSHYAPNQKGTKTTFPARNAMIAGMSNATLIVECQERSGTMVEARMAAEMGRKVMFWGPLMRELAWAQRWAKEHGAVFVDSLGSIASAARCRVGRDRPDVH